MKKLFVAFLLAGVMMLSFAVPTIATEAIISPTTYVTTGQASIAEGQEITPFTEMTRIYWRNATGGVQFRVWSITNGRWLTPWTYV